MEEMNKISGLAQDERLLVTNMSTCIPRCEKYIYGTICFDAEMGDKRWLFNKKRLKRDVNERIKKGGD
jgi:hypothetical protein